MELKEVFSCIESVEWDESFSIDVNGTKLEHQTAYNKALGIEFGKYGWTKEPLLCQNPKLIGDFQKNDVFVEVQFGNSATLYRDYYKFYYGILNRMLSLAVLIVPVDPVRFFPSRPRSVSNMAEYDLACRYFKLLPLPIPIVVIGLLPGRADSP